MILSFFLPLRLKLPCQNGLLSVILLQYIIACILLNIMDVNIEQSWKEHIGAEFCKQYFVDLAAFVHSEYLHTLCFPLASSSSTLSTCVRLTR